MAPAIQSWAKSVYNQVMTFDLIAAIDTLLPQTQCGLCGYPGCRPYAESITTNHESIDRCLPGGVKTLQKIAAVVGQDPSPFIAEMQQKQKPPQVAKIREAECIGCTKCIQACPVDAIIGASKQMHTIVADECTGCELCIEPCPVDCIELTTVPEKNDREQQKKTILAKRRYESRNYRLAKEKSLQSKPRPTISVEQRKAEIAAAIERNKIKRPNTKAF